MAALMPIYQAESAGAARERLEEFDRGPWGQKYPAIAQSWRRNWERVIPSFAFVPELRKIIYTPTPSKASTPRYARAVRIRGHFPSEKAATKLIYLVLRKVQARWKIHRFSGKPSKPNWRTSSRIASWWRNKMAAGSQSRLVASSPVRRQAFARKAPASLRWTASGAPAQQEKQLLTQLLLPLTSDSENTKILTLPAQIDPAMKLVDSVRHPESIASAIAPVPSVPRPRLPAIA
jgi:hypothetical protein